MPANYKQLIALYDQKPKAIRTYFEDFPSLVEDYNWRVVVAYVFSRIEAVKHTTLYCGIVKLHHTDAALTWDMLNKDHMSRGRFKELFSIVFGKAIDKQILDQLASAERIRDRAVHGKQLSSADARVGIRDALNFCEAFNDFVSDLAGFRPFCDLRGFSGRREKLSKDTTRWVLRGMGIPAKEVAA